MRSVLAALPIVILFLGTSAEAQPDQRTTLRVKTQLVQVDVVVKDAHGNPVRDLKKSDFEVYDNGKLQEVRVFNVEDYTTLPVTAAPVAPAPPANTQPEVRSFSNRVAAAPNAINPATVIVIDAGNTWDPARVTWPDLVQARDALVKFLRQVRPEDRLGIYLMGPNRFWVLREYTQDCADLIERLASWKGSATPGLADTTGAKPLDAWTEFAVHFIRVDAETAKAIHHAQFGATTSGYSPALPPEPDRPGIHTGMDGRGLDPYLSSGGSAGLTLNDRGVFVPTDQSRFLTVLTSVAEHLAALPGRKNVILISGQTFLPIEHQDRVKVLRNILRTGVSLYTIDPGGLAPYQLDGTFVIPSAVTAFTPSGQQVAQVAMRYVGQAEAQKRYIMQMLQSSLEWLAEETGGKAFLNTNDLARAIRTSFDDSRVVYTLGFYAKSPNNQGAYHGLKVKVAGENLTVRARPGYFEPAEPSHDRKVRESELRQAVWSPVDASLIELHGAIQPLGKPEDRVYTLNLNIGAAGLSLLPQGDRLSGQVEVIVVQRDSSGNDYDPSSQTLGVKVEEANYERLMQGGVAYRRAITPNPKATSLRVIVRDVSTGNMGTLTIPLAPGT